MSARAPYAGHKLYFTVDSTTLAHLLLYAHGRHSSLSVAILEWCEFWRTLGGLAHSHYQALILHAQARRLPLSVTVAELLASAAARLPPPSSPLATPLRVFDEAELRALGITTRGRQVGARFTIQQHAHLSRAAALEGRKPNHIAAQWLLHWRTLGGLAPAAYERLVQATHQRRIHLSSLVADLLLAELQGLELNEPSPDVQTPIDLLPVAPATLGRRPCGAQTSPSMPASR